MTRRGFDSLTEPERRERDAALAGQDSGRWDRFYEDRARPCPFFGTAPDESLVGWVAAGCVPPGKALDLGCGNARNSIYLAQSGFSVEAVDYSASAIAWARERVRAAGVTVSLVHANVFELAAPSGDCALVYDSGCFHHIAPHRRAEYVAWVNQALKPGGWFGLTCFRPEGGGGYSDDEVYAHGSLGGGLGYTEVRLREIWSRDLHIHEFRQMAKQAPGSGLFGEDFLWAMLAQKVGA